MNTPKDRKSSSTADDAMGDVRAAIERRIVELKSEMRRKLEETGSLSRYLGSADDSADLALSDEVAEVDHAEVRRDAGELHAAERALERIDAGSYGECEACGVAIPPARLKVQPLAVTCVACQEKREAGQGRL